MLQGLSNPDKHRTLTIVNPSWRVKLSDVDDVCDTDSTSTQESVQMQSHITSHIAFDDGRRVVETLHELERDVRGVLKCYQPEFG